MNHCFLIVAWPVHFQSQVDDSHAYDVEPLSSPTVTVKPNSMPTPSLASISVAGEQYGRLCTRSKNESLRIISSVYEVRLIDPSYR